MVNKKTSNDRLNFLFLNFHSEKNSLIPIIKYLEYSSKEKLLNISVLHKNILCKSEFLKRISELNHAEDFIERHLILDDNYSKIEEDFSKLLDTYNIKVVILFNGSLTIYNIDKTIILLDKVLKRKNIKFYWVAPSFLKGRFDLAEDIYFKSNDIYLKYKEILESQFSKNQINLLKEYTKKYWEFKENVHTKNVTVKAKIRLKNFLSLRFSIRFIINKLMHLRFYFFKLYKRKYIVKKFDDLKMVDPYILFLATKSNQWFNKYANPDFKDPSKYIKFIIDSVPKTHKLIIKPHPRDESLIMKTPKDPNIIFYTGELKEIIKNADLIISTGSTSGLEAMTLYKKIIYLGANSYLGEIEESIMPIKILNSVNNLKLEVLKILSEPIDQKRQKSYLLTLLEKTYSYDDKHFSLSRDERFLQIVATSLIEKLRGERLL